MTSTYLATLMQLTANVRPDHRVGVETSAKERHAYWIDGRTLGVLHCLGEADHEDAAGVAVHRPQFPLWYGGGRRGCRLRRRQLQ